MSSYTFVAELTFLEKDAKFSLSVDNNQGTGSLEFLQGPFNVNEALDDLLNDLDMGTASPFGTLPSILIQECDINTFEDGKISGVVLEAIAEEFNVFYGSYSEGTSPKDAVTQQSFSIQLDPFTIDTLPGINIKLDEPVTIDISEAGVVTGDYTDANGNSVDKGVYIRGQFSAPDVDPYNLIYPGSSESAQVNLGDGDSTNTDDGLIKWFDVNKVFGPAKISQVGLKWKDGKIWALVNASISFAGISLDLMGLGAGVEVKIPVEAPEFTLGGLGLSFDVAGVEVAGGFDKVTPTVSGVTSEFDGTIEIKYGDLTIDGIGSYAKINGHDSIFVYAYLGYPIGGPNFFFVEGLALGFGYNRQLIMPPLDQVQNFPLVAKAMGNDVFGGSSDPLTILTEYLDPYIPPMEGELLLTAGIKFSTYQIIDSFLLLAVDFGQRTRFDLIGLSQLSMPPDDNDDPVVFVQIALEASLDPDKGAVQVTGMITDQSYVYSKDAHLSGGFAFYAWFKDQTDSQARAGDFVVSLGGYNPNFQKPDYYPTVPRFALNWKVNNDLDVKADAYFAMTPRYAMAGYQLKAAYKDNSLAASFTEGADFLIQWKPFHYDITANVSIKASFTAKVHLGFVTVHKTFHLDLGADVHLWGPKFSGHADIHVKVLGVGFSFDINFGSGNKKPAPLAWEAFQSAFLPSGSSDNINATEESTSSDSNGISISAANGLLKKMPDSKDSSAEIWIFNPNDLNVQVDTMIPMTGVNLDGDATTFDGVKYGSGPMGLSSGEFESTLNVTVTDLTKSTEEGDVFAITSIQKQMPAALWGEQSSDINAASTINGIGGINLKIKDQAGGDNSLGIPADNLAYETTKNAYDNWSYNDTNTDDFSYDESLFEEYLPEYSFSELPQLSGSDPETIAETLQSSQDFMATPQVVNIMQQYSS